MTNNFSGKDPRALTANRVARAQADAEANTFVSNNFSTVAPGVPVCACAFGTQQEEIDAAQDLFSTSPIDTQNSEAIGEVGALHFLKQLLRAQNIPFNEDCLETFNGKNAFNMVYFDAEPPNATRAIIIEAKGGDSTLGSRMDFAGQQVVEQSSKEYADTIIQVMSHSPDPDRQRVGDQLGKLFDKQPPQILYLGVATKYNKPKQVVHNPVPIFANKI